MDTSELLKRLKEIDPQALADAHDELIGGFDEKGQPISLGDPVFEMDGKMHRVPFQQLRDTLQGKEPQSVKKKSDDFSSAIRGAFTGINPASTLKSHEIKQAPHESMHAPDDGYYWDKNYNYEYMNPEAEKQRVLGKIKK